MILSGGDARVAKSLEAVLMSAGKDESAQEMVADFETEEELLAEMNLATLLWEASPAGGMED
ncbi:MAG: hypothetical protein ACYDA8_00935 [Deferrisomatales bacterium]